MPPFSDFKEIFKALQNSHTSTNKVRCHKIFFISKNFVWTSIINYHMYSYSISKCLEISNIGKYPPLPIAVLKLFVETTETLHWSSNFEYVYVVVWWIPIFTELLFWIWNGQTSLIQYLKGTGTRGYNCLKLVRYMVRYAWIIIAAGYYSLFS